MDLLNLTGADWAAWRVVLKAAFALPMTDEELILFRALTGRESPPSRRTLELWLVCGRRAGKSTIAALAALYLAISADVSVFAKPDELVVAPLIARDRRQVRVLLGHLRSFARTLELRKFIARSDLKDSIQLASGILIECGTATSRGTRGYTSCAVVCDEVAYWQDEGADPSDEILTALRPTLGTVPGSMLLALSNPFAPRGPLFDVVQQSYGQADDDVLVIIADTLTLHPSYNEAVIKRAFAADPVKAMSEYGTDGRIDFRQASTALFDQAPVDQAIVAGRAELPPVANVTYKGFLDAAQGARSGDSFTLGIAHEVGGRSVLDIVLERKPPFNPLSVLVADFVPVLERYGVTKVVGDQVSSGFVEATLRTCGIRFEASARNKSDIYLQSLSLINSGAVELLDVPTLRLQLLSLQRFAVSGGKDRVDHPRGKQAHDDLANAAAGALVLASGVTAKPRAQALWSFGGTHRSASVEDRKAEDREKLAALATATIRKLDREAESTAAILAASEEEPMLSAPIWHVNGR